MALGGGNWVTQNKVLPGAYINFISAARASSNISARGVAAMPVQLAWGPEETVFEVTAEDFNRRTNSIFGYPLSADEMKNFRELFRGARLCYLYRLNSGGVKAANTFCTAKHPGIVGNALQTVIVANEASTVEAPLFDVITLLRDTVVDEQRGVSTMAGLAESDFVDWSLGATIALTAGTPLTGGANGTATNASYQKFLDAIEPYTFNTLGLASTDTTINALFENFTRRMRDDVGAKFQCVLYKRQSDYEGIISVENKLLGETAGADAVYWVTGAQAGCAVNASLTNRTYDGELDIDVNYTQSQLEDALRSGRFIFHRVGSEIRVLEDINTLVTLTDTKGEAFRSNQVIRVLDQIGNDIAALFNDRYLGKIPNDASGRISLWGDIVRSHQDLERIGAIEDFASGDVTVEQGDSRKSVVVTASVTPANAMTQLYMTVVIE